MKQIILIGGAPRSGTTLMQQMLDSHPEVHGPFGEWLGIGLHHAKLARRSGVARPRSVADIRRIFEYGLANTPMRRLGFNLEQALEAARDYEPSWEAFPLILFEAMRRGSGASRIAVKVPFLETHFERLNELLSAAGWSPRFLYVVRHPFDVYLSHRRRSRDWSRTLRHTDVLRWAGDWKRSTELALDLPATLGVSFRRAQFEEATADPIRICRELCGWIGSEDFSERMVELKGVEPNSSFQKAGEATVGGVHDFSGRDRPNLSDAEADVIRAVCGLRARTFGYDLGACTRPREVAYLDQHTALARLEASDYARFVPRDLWRRGVRVLKTLYSMAGGKPTRSLLP